MQNILNQLYRISFFSNFRFKYRYNFTPPQLKYFMDTLEKSKKYKGSVVEIGCYKGDTTVFLAKYLQDSGINRKYFAVDTFAGFTNDDIKIEKVRGKENISYVKRFKNSEFIIRKNLELNNIKIVEVIKADANNLDFSIFNEVVFCLIDTDLYRPCLNSLKKIYPLIVAGGIIIVDDCKTNNDYDGAYQAYQEFCRALSITPQILYDKLGIINK